MNIRLFATTSLAAMALALPAAAQDWSGFYVGAQAGSAAAAENDDETIRFDTNLDGGFGDSVNTVAGANAFSPGFCGGATASNVPGTGCSGDDDGFEFGMRTGYDWQFGNFVVGVVGEASRSNAEDSVTAFSTTPAFYTMTRKLKYIGALRARAGWAFDRNLVYATGGYAVGKIDNSFNTGNTANTFVLNDDDRADGYQLGAGYERQLTEDVTLGLEYIYTKLEDDGFRVRAQGPAAATNPFLLANPAGTDFRRSETDFEVQSVRATATYRF